MTPREEGFLLLSCAFGDPERNPLTGPQLRVLAQRVRHMGCPQEDRALTSGDLAALGYSPEDAGRILSLLEGQPQLGAYLRRGKALGCVPLTRISVPYPPRLREALGLDAPACLWARGDVEILQNRMIALVGSRDLLSANREFAQAVGRQAALQGYTLVSGNARGADCAAQEACLQAGGSVVSIVADALSAHRPQDRLLFLSEAGYDEAFSAQRALSRNRCIHALGNVTFVAQATLNHGGTWSGTVKNLYRGWSQVYCFRDGSEASGALVQMGADWATAASLDNLSALENAEKNLFDLAAEQSAP